MAALYCQDTTGYQTMMRQMHGEKFTAGSTLADFKPRKDSKGLFHERCGVKWFCHKPFSSAGKERDYCLIDYCAVRQSPRAGNDGGGNGDRIGIQLFYSTERPNECPDYSSSGYTRSCLLPSGYVIYPTAQPNVVEVIFCWSCRELTEIKRGHKKGILGIVQAITQLEHWLRVGRLETPVLKPQSDWIANESRTKCFICSENFGTFRRKHHCRICGDITCSKCSNICAVKLAAPNQVRICHACQNKSRAIPMVQQPPVTPQPPQMLAPVTPQPPQMLAPSTPPPPPIADPPSNRDHVPAGPLPSKRTSDPRFRRNALQEEVPHRSLSKLDTHENEQHISELGNKGTSLEADTMMPLQKPAKTIHHLGDTSNLTIDEIKGQHRQQQQVGDSSSFDEASDVVESKPQFGNLTRVTRQDSDSESIQTLDEEEMYSSSQNVDMSAIHFTTQESLEEDSSDSPLLTTEHQMSSAESIITSDVIEPFQYDLDFRWKNRWPKSPVPRNEASRLLKLRHLGVLGSSQEEDEYDIMTLSAVSKFDDAAFAFISFMDEDREWFKATNGIPASNAIPRHISFCAHVLMSTSPTIVLDTQEDVRFRDNPLVLAQPRIRFYVAVPIVSREGFVLGSVAVADVSPKSSVTTDQVKALEKLASHVVNRIDPALDDDDDDHSREIGSFATVSNEQQAFGFDPNQMQNTLESLLQQTYQTSQQVNVTGTRLGRE